MPLRALGGRVHRLITAARIVAATTSRKLGASTPATPTPVSASLLTRQHCQLLRIEGRYGGAGIPRRARTLFCFSDRRGFRRRLFRLRLGFGLGFRLRFQGFSLNELAVSAARQAQRQPPERYSTGRVASTPTGHGCHRHNRRQPGK